MYDGYDNLSPSTRTLRRALKAFESEDALAHALGVTPSYLRLWLDGSDVPPHDVFIRALELASRHTEQKAAKVNGNRRRRTKR